jgi:5'-nucleotidase
MNVLLSNDDGYFAPGIHALAQALGELEQVSKIDLIAPDRNRSAASNSLTLMEPLRLRAQNWLQDKVTAYSVNGTPTDCVHLGVNGALGHQPDMVVSGINAGANMGDDVIYSGTVAAATEGRFLDRLSIAISLCGDQHFDTAAAVFKKSFSFILEQFNDPNTIVNINVPDIPIEKIKGFKITRLGRRHCSEPVVEQLDPRGLPIFWIGPAGSAQDAEQDTDFFAVENGYVSITPLRIDLTDYDLLKRLNSINLSEYVN